jgi:hypothetical protein
VDVLVHPKAWLDAMATLGLLFAFDQYVVSTFCPVLCVVGVWCGAQAGGNGSEFFGGQAF